MKNSQTKGITPEGKEVEELNRKVEKRPYGLCKGEFEVPEDFDKELPHDIIADFEGR